MCGIGGIFSTNQSIELIPNALKLSALNAHRGPDDEGFVAINSEFNTTHFKSSNSVSGIDFENILVAKNDYLGIVFHRRLSIVSPGIAGHQPMQSSSGKYVLSYNGEIFNYRELDKKYNFINNSNTDTETLLQLWELKQENCLSELDGFFAFCVYSTQNKTVTLARDRMGIKPLFYFVNATEFVFCSEIKPIQQITKTSEINQQAIVNHVLFAAQTNNEKIGYLSKIIALEKGNCLVYQIENKKIHLHKFFNPEFQQNSIHIGELKSDMVAAVQSRLMSDVPIGFAISGGLDSAIIVGIARKILGRDYPFHCFSVISDGIENESQWQKNVVDFNHTHWHTFNANTLNVVDMEKNVNHSLLPMVAWNNIAHEKLMQTASEHGIRVFFNGQGADELFCGYPSYLIREFKKIKKIITKNGKNFPLKVNDIRNEYKKLLIKKILPKSVYFFMQNELLNSTMKSYFEPTNLESNITDFFGRRFGQMLFWDDINGMQYSIESRNPFADDYTLMHKYINATIESKLQGNFTKGALRLACQEFLPKEIAWRTDKKGFSVPELVLTKQNFNSLKPYFLSNKLNEYSSLQIRENWLRKNSDLNSIKQAQLFLRIASMAMFFYALEK